MNTIEKRFETKQKIVYNQSVIQEERKINNRKSLDGYVRTPHGIVIVNSDPLLNNDNQWWVHLQFINSGTIHQKGLRTYGEPTKKGLATIAGRYAKENSEQKIRERIIYVPQVERTLWQKIKDWFTKR